MPPRHVIMTVAYDKDDTLLEFVATDSGTCEWQAARDIAAGTTIFDEAPLAAVPLIALDDTRALLMPEQCSPPSSSAEWQLVHDIVKAHTSLERPHHDLESTCGILLRPGATSRAKQWQTAVREAAKGMSHVHALDAELAKTAADDTESRDKLTALRRATLDRARSLQRVCGDMYTWIARIRKVMPDLTTHDVLTTYDIIVANALEMRTPVSNARYGLALYASAAHMRHACTPNARLEYGRRGHMYVVAARALRAGDVITVNRFVPTPQLVRCVQTAPASVRDAFDGAAGRVCACTECRAALTTFRQLVAAKRAPDVADSAPPVTSEADIAVVERAVNSTWHVTEPTPAMRALATSLETTSLLRAVLASPFVLTILPALVLDALETDTASAALSRVLREPDASMPHAMLAHALVAHCHAGGDVPASLLGDAARVLRTTSEASVRRVLVEQQMPASEIEHRARYWRAHVAYLCADATLDVNARDLIATVATWAGNDAVTRTLFIEQCFSPRVALNMAASRVPAPNTR